MPVPDCARRREGLRNQRNRFGQRSEAIPLIAKALAQGYHAPEFERSPELASLRADPAFQSALTQAKGNSALHEPHKAE